ncbi:MAG: hypothetical protein WAN12_13285 [Candidatus Acidiferrum sp.]
MAFVGNTRHNIFISWSGRRSLWIAEALRGWLPLVIQAARPWMSEKEVLKGSRGLHEIAQALEGIKVGITCLTPENLGAPWILYEAGALSKALDDQTRLCTYLLGGLQFQDVKPPLGMFQATKAEKDDTRKLIQSINMAIGEQPVPESSLDEIFDAMWPKLAEKLRTIPAAEEDVVAKRDMDEMITEILEISRAEANRRRKVDSLDAFVPLFDELLPILPQIREAIRTAKNQMLAGSLMSPSSSPGAMPGALPATNTAEQTAPSPLAEEA